MPTNADDGRIKVVDAELQLYARRLASLLAASQSKRLYTSSPKQEQPAEKQETLSGKVDVSEHTLQLSIVLHDRFTVVRRSTA
jgi:hypothetical protein